MDQERQRFFIHGTSSTTLWANKVKVQVQMRWKQIHEVGSLMKIYDILCQMGEHTYNRIKTFLFTSIGQPKWFMEPYEDLQKITFAVLMSFVLRMSQARIYSFFYDKF